MKEKFNLARYTKFIKDIDFDGSVIYHDLIVNN